ncbi:hypothetical protein ACFYW9_29365 [Streptomyces sp. NPDC002698]|uniref:hypothetical protein n=1 Tax=Streptomyces sp. NPDC002698 TaxID=3364660 RepID=UPI0036A4004B
MADETALPAQEFADATYGTGIGMTVEEDERTSRNAMHSLAHAPRREPGTSSLPNSFGPGTMSALRPEHPIACADRQDLFIVPCVDPSEADTGKVLIRCQGTTADTKTEGRKRRSPSRTFAKYHAPMREHA